MGIYRLKPHAESLLFAAVLLLLPPIQTEVVDPVFQIVGLTYFITLMCDGDYGEGTSVL